MSGCGEFGRCDICGEDKLINRQYYYYDIKCECHSPNHAEIVYYCNNCKPVEPKLTNVLLKTSDLSKRRIKLEKIEKNINNL